MDGRSPSRWPVSWRLRSWRRFRADVFLHGTDSAPTMTPDMGTFRVFPWDTLTREVDAGCRQDWHSKSPVADRVKRGLVYAGRPGSVTVHEDCVSQFGFRMTSDTLVSLLARH